MPRARKRGERGVILVEFALVIVVFSMMVIGGLFVLLRMLSKSTSASQVTAAANFVALGGCPSTTTTTGPTTTTLPPCADGGTPTVPCGLSPDDYSYSGTTTTVPVTTTTSLGTMTDEATLATLCEIATQLQGSFVVTDPSSLEVAINCSAAAYTDPGVSGQPCAGSKSVWVCARAWDSNDYPGIISAGWVTSRSEELVQAQPVTTTSSASVPSSVSTTAGPTSAIPEMDFETFFPATPTGTDAGAGTPPLTCGPMG